MSMSRRSFIRIAGSSAVIVAAGTGCIAVTRTPTEALAPWKLAGTDYADPRMRALSYAILAPNPHNRQPWLVDFKSETEATLYCDLDRLLPATDPQNRQITIGLGCFLELLRMAAAEEGIRLEIDPFPEGEDPEGLDDRPVANLYFEADPTVERDPLFQHVLTRRSVKEPYDTKRPISQDLLDGIVSATDEDILAETTNDMSFVKELRDLSWRAHYIEMMTPYTMQESVDLMRIGKKEINANPDGIDLGGALFEGMNLVGLMTRETLADQNSTSFKQGLDIYKKMLDTGMAYVWVKTDDNTRIDQINSGRNWVRINLQVTALGLSVHPLSQALQEYPEMDELYAEIHERLGAAEGQTVQMFGRLGYGPKKAPSPRWRIETRMRS